MEHFEVKFEPDGKKLLIHSGATILEAAEMAGIVLNTTCGGKGTCGKCAVKIGTELKKVLACQSKIESDIVVTIPQGSRFFEQRILTAGIERQEKIVCDIFKRYKDIAGGKIFGAAVDVGTTTVVVKLVDMESSRSVGCAAAVNPQVRFGDDVISRIAYGDSAAKRAELQKAITECVDELIGRLCSEAGIGRDDVYEVSVVGNTTMNHIFLNWPLEQLGQAPYKAYCVAAVDVRPDKVGIRINKRGNVHTVENIAGFVGSDTNAVALAVGAESLGKVSLIVDIGTNGEIVLAAGGRLCAASCAAGPALEGARISCGSRATEGAIEAVVINGGDIDIDVIGGVEARSICGSGLIDATAVMLELGVIDATGRFAAADELAGKAPEAVLKRIIEIDGQGAFVLSKKGGAKVVLTQKDVREVQLAKAAIRAGITLLIKEMGLRDGDIEQVLLAGAFGNYIRRESALRIGLLANVEPARIHFIGNAASTGAEMVLLSSAMREGAGRLARKIEYIEIAHLAEFSAVYAECMMF